MTHPGEQYYPKACIGTMRSRAVRCPICCRRLPRLTAPRPAIEFRDRPISYTELEAMVEIAASAFLRAGYGKGTCVALFLGNSPDHPVNFFGALKAGARRRASVAARRRDRAVAQALPIPARAFWSPATCRRCCRWR